MAATARHERAMKEKYKKASMTETDPVKKLQAQCLMRGASGIKGIGRTFRIMDDDGSKSIDFNEFKYGCNDYGLFLETEDEYKAAFASIDKDGSGHIDFNEFLRALRPPINQSRQSLIRRAFRKLDKDESGHLTVEDLKGVYSVQHHKKYQSGEMTEDEVLAGFLATFEGDGGQKGDGQVTWDEFLDYYAGVSASVDTDAYFNLMMVQAWKL